MLQVRERHLPDFNWPTRFPWTHQTALLGVLLVTVLAIDTWARGADDPTPQADDGSAQG